MFFYDDQEYCDIDFDGPSSPGGRPPSSRGTGSDTDDSMDTVYSLPPFSPIPSSSETSNEQDELQSVSSAIMSSPAPSVYSITSSLIQQSFRQEYGRGVNNYSEIYRLPADEEEIARLNRQHRMFKMAMGPWAPLLPETLASEPGITKSVLDVGCGSGAWITDVARAFPECSAVGVDLVPMQSPMPPNCRSEVDDVNLGLEHFYDSFDAIHARLISSGIKDYASLINHMARCLRPRGLIMIEEFNFRLYHPDKTVLPPWSTVRPPDEAPYLCRWFAAVGFAARQRGGDIDAATYMHNWVQEHHSFMKEDIFYEEYWFPTGPWEHKDEWGGVGKYPREFSELVQEDILSFLRGGRPLLLGSGMPPEHLDLLEANARREVEESRIPFVFRIQCVYARKKAAG